MTHFRISIDCSVYLVGPLNSGKWELKWFISLVIVLSKEVLFLVSWGLTLCIHRLVFKDLRDPYADFITLSLQCSFFYDFLSCKFMTPWLPQTLITVFSTQWKQFHSLCSSRNFLWEESWWDHSAYLCVHFLSRTTVLNCLFFNL